MRSLVAATFCVVVGLAPSAFADSTTSDAGVPPVVVVKTDDAATIDPVKRTDPSAFRGRENYGDAGDALAWIPRVIFFPVYLTTEYVLRRPTDAFAGWVDENHVVPIIRKILDPIPQFSWNPALALDFGTFVALGVDVRLHDIFVKGHEMSGTVLSSGLDGYMFALRDSWRLDDVVHVGVKGGGSYHQDRRFYGFGYKSSINDLSYFAETRYEAFAFQDFDYRKHVHVEASEGFRSDLSGPGFFPSSGGVFPPQSMPAYGAQMDLAMAMLDVKLDTRRQPLEPSGGARLFGNVTYAHDVSNPERTFVTATLDGQIAAEVMKPDRILSLRAYAVDTWALGSEPVPFTYDAMLGFDHHLGFIWGRFRDASALMAELRYHYPIAYYFDMEWVASVGNVFMQNFADFKPERLTSSLSVGLLTRRTGLLPIELLVGFGTTRFDEAFNINSVRVYLSTTENL